MTQKWTQLGSAAEELARAREELGTARQLLDQLPRVAASRTYFAVFHAVRGFLVAHGFEAKNPAAVQQLFDREAVETGMLPAAASRLFARLQNAREEADYAPTFTGDPGETSQNLAEAQKLVARLAALVAGK